MPEMNQCPYCAVLLSEPTALCPSCHRAAKPPFPQVRWREGYRMSDVDSFVDQVNTDIFTAPVDQIVDRINQVRFTPVRMTTGYDMQAVDVWLDQLVKALKARQA